MGWIARAACLAALVLVAACDGTQPEAGDPAGGAPQAAAPAPGAVAAESPATIAAAEERFAATFAEVECAVARERDAARHDELKLETLTARGYDLGAYVADKRRFAESDKARAAREACLPAAATPRFAPPDDTLVAVAAALRRLGARELAPADRKDRELRVLQAHRLTREQYEWAAQQRLGDPAFRRRVDEAVASEPDGAEAGPRPAVPPDPADLPAIGDDFPRVAGAAVARACLLRQGLPTQETDDRLAELLEAYRLSEDELDEGIERYQDAPRFRDQFRTGTGMCSPADMAVPPSGLWSPAPAGPSNAPAGAAPALDEPAAGVAPAAPLLPPATGGVAFDTPARGEPLVLPEGLPPSPAADEAAP